MRVSTVFWYLLISLSATVPGLNLIFLLTPPEAGAAFFFALEVFLALLLAAELAPDLDIDPFFYAFLSLGIFLI